MLYFYYESGNNEVALSQSKIESTMKQYIDIYKKGKGNTFLISQVDAINCIGDLIFQELIEYNDVSIILPEFNKQLLFDQLGVLNESWYEVVPHNY